MAPNLVIADAPYKVYPGGVIALRCTDWMGGARGTLTSESDVRAITGECVRETQQVANSLFSDSVAAFAAADDTLELDFAAIPVELDMTYSMHLSLLIEGDWDPTNADTSRSSTQALFSYACQVGWYGDSLQATTEADFNTINHLPRGLDHYVIGHFGGNWTIDDVAGTEVIRIRAYAHAGTSVEFLLDQVFLIPQVRDGATHGDWKNADFSWPIPGGANDFGAIGFEPADPGGLIDGADGGDANGKFTWLPFQGLSNQQSNWSGSDGGGDYQRVADYEDAEYMLRMVLDDFWDVYDSRTFVEPVACHGYSAQGQLCRPAQVYVDDGFSRTIAPTSFPETDGWGETPEGFVWYVTPDETGGHTEVDGSVGIHRMGGAVNSLNGTASYLGRSDADGRGALLRMDDFTFSGKVLVTSPDPWFDGGTTAFLGVSVGSQSGGQVHYSLVIDPIGETWSLTSDPASTLHGPIDISSWYAEDSYIGFKIELKRYVIRVKLWDASGAEPGGWDYEEFRPLYNAGTAEAYPYNDDLDISQSVSGAYWVNCFSGHDTALFQWETHWDDFVLDYDPYGTRDEISIATERPEGTSVGEIVVPDGAQHMVYWGQRDWTDDDGFGSSVLVFSSRIWNAVTAAELQQARLLWYWFRSIRGGIVSMNWSSALPVDITRVHG